MKRAENKHSLQSFYQYKSLHRYSLCGYENPLNKFWSKWFLLKVTIVKLSLVVLCETYLKNYHYEVQGAIKAKVLEKYQDLVENKSQTWTIKAIIKIKNNIIIALWFTVTHNLVCMPLIFFYSHLLKNKFNIISVYAAFFILVIYNS